MKERKKKKEIGENYLQLTSERVNIHNIKNLLKTKEEIIYNPTKNGKKCE